MESEQLRELEIKSHVAIVFGNFGGAQVPGKVWRSLATGRVLLVILADNNDPLAQLPELSSRAVVVQNNEDAIGQGILDCLARVERWPWHSLESLAPLPEWRDRAKSLLDFVQRQSVSPRQVPANRFGFPAVAMPALGTIFGLKLQWLWERAWARR
ncbi:MAG: hypothetical protein U0V87_08125 [Acidobacteriota bacterium]